MFTIWSVLFPLSFLRPQYILSSFSCNIFISPWIIEIILNYLFINVTTLFDAFRSGTEEEYTELQQLLDDINSFKRDMEELKYKEIMKKKQKQKQDREKGLQMREAALSGMASKSFPEITFIALKNQFTVFGDWDHVHCPHYGCHQVIQLCVCVCVCGWV